MNAIVTIAPKIGKLIPLLGSDKAGEVVAAADAVGRTLRQAGRDWHDLAAAIETGMMASAITTTKTTKTPTDDGLTALDIARYCHNHDDGRLSRSERDFLNNAIRMLAYGDELTAKQWRWLSAIYRMLGGRA